VPFDSVEAVHVTDTVLLPALVLALALGALSVPTLAVALPEPWVVQ